MPITRKIVISFLLLVQIPCSGAAAEDCLEGVETSKTIALVCENGERIEGVSSSLLANNFGFFKSFFERWNRSTVRIQGSVDDMCYLLAFVRSVGMVDVVVVPEPKNVVSLMILADQLLLKKEVMDCLKEQYGEAVSRELYSGSFYEEFLRGKRETISAAWAIDKKYTPAPIFEPTLSHSTAGFQKDQCNLRRQRQQQEAREKQDRRKQYEKTGKRNRINVIIRELHIRAAYPDLYSSQYFRYAGERLIKELHDLQEEEKREREVASEQSQRSRPLSLFMEQERREKQRKRNSLTFLTKTKQGPPVVPLAQQEEIIEEVSSQKRVKPTVFNKERTRGVGILPTKIQIYDDAEHLLFEHSFSLGKCRQGYAIGEVVFEEPYRLRVRFQKRGSSENSYYIHDETVYLPCFESTRDLEACTNEEKYLYHVLRSKVKDTGHKLDRLSLSSSELQAMFDRLPRTLRSEILTPDGRVERVIAKRVAGIYGRMKQSSENKCRELQVYKSA
jgi:hypothetical protein